jgi:hypothetical protein
VDGLVVPLQVVVPDGAAFRQDERGGLVGHPRPVAGDDVAEGDRVVVGPQLQRVAGAALGVPDRDFQAVAAIDRLGVAAEPRVSLIHPVRLGRAEFGGLAQVHAVHGDRQRRRLDDRPALERYREPQPAVLREDPQLDGAVRACDLGPVGGRGADGGHEDGQERQRARADGLRHVRAPSV